MPGVDLASIFAQQIPSIGENFTNSISDIAGSIGPLGHLFGAYGRVDSNLDDPGLSSPQAEEDANSLGVSLDSSVAEALDGGWSLSQYMNEHPGASYEQIWSEAAKHGDEFAEKYLDYLTEKGELDAANQYTANREDTAYQRLVADLKKAGLNPAMMYGSTASTSASGSQGYVKMTEGANQRTISNYDKMKNLLLAILKYELQKGLGIANTVIDGIGAVTDIADLFMPTKIVKG